MSRLDRRIALGSYLGTVPRKPRTQIPGAAYHLTARAVARQELFRDVDDRVRFLKLLAGVISRYEWACHAYCLMSTHYHLLIRTPVPNLASGMQRLNGCYAQYFNKRHGETGHRFERRYQDVLIESEAHALELFRYIALNPVRAGACAKPVDWRWSSYADLLTTDQPPPYLSSEWLLAYFGGDRRRALVRLEQFVSDRSR